MQLKYRHDITWHDMPRIERPLVARSKLSADLSGPRPRISRMAYNNPLSEVYGRGTRNINPDSLQHLYRKIERGEVMLVLNTDYDVFSPAFIWIQDPEHKDKGEWQLSQDINSVAEFNYQSVLTQVRKPGPRGGLREPEPEVYFPGANWADSGRSVVNTGIDTANTVTDGYRKRELAEYSGRYPELNSGVTKNPMEIDKLKYDDEAYGEFAGTIAGAVAMVGTRKPPKSLKGAGDSVISKKSGKVVSDTIDPDHLRLISSHPNAHSLVRHGGDVTDKQLMNRALTGKSPDGFVKEVNGKIILPPMSSAFHSDELLVQADQTIRKGALKKAISENPDATIITIKPSDAGDLGVDLGRGFERIGGSRYRPGTQGPPEMVENLRSVQATYELNPGTNTWETITIFPARS